LEGHAAPVYSFSFSPDRQRIASGSADRSVRVWNAETGQTVLGPLKGHNGCIRSVSFSRDGQRIVSCSAYGLVLVWDAKTGEILTGLLVGHSHVLAASFSPDGRRIVTGSLDGTVRVWNTEATPSIVRSLINADAGAITYYKDSGTCLFNLSK
jgi:WD40 repeat protein